MKHFLLLVLCSWFFTHGWGQSPVIPEKEQEKLWKEINPYFSPPEIYKDKCTDLCSPLKFYNGDTVNSVGKWSQRRNEILTRWHEMMGQWPELIVDQKLEVTETTNIENFTQKKVRFKWLPNTYTEGYLLIPKGKNPKPAVIIVYYEPETAIGKGKPYRDYAYQLTKRGFITLSIGTTEATNAKTYSLYYPSIEDAKVQPLSMLAYAAANAWNVLAREEGVDSTRIGIGGHSFGGKWAMFASCLYEKFACAVWSDPGIVLDETKGSAVNYWEPWYLGYYPPPWDNTWRKTGLTGNAKGLYPILIEEGYNLHELHALMAPRPFLVSGGSSDPPVRWRVLNHTIAVNELLGYHNRVAMTNRPDHSPNEESNEQIYSFFRYFLMK